MNKLKFSLTIFFFFLFLTILFLKPNIVKAQDLEVACDGSGSCTLFSPEPLFSTSQDGLWYPGKSIAKTLRIRNNHPTDATTVSTNAQNPQIDSSPCQLDKQLSLSIVRVGATLPWAGSLNDFYQETSVPLAIFSPGSFDDFIFTVFFPSSVSNECQDKTTLFDLLLNFSGETIATTPAPTSTPAPGAVLGAGVSAPVCTDASPGGAPTLTSAVGGVNTATLTWSPAADPVSYYLIAYRISPGNYQFGNPNIGGKGTTSYTISGLSGGVTYYFVVRAGNGCAPGAFSNEVAVTPAGGAVAGPAPGFLPGVLGEKTPGELGGAGATEAGEIAGAETKPYNWWILILIGLAGIGGGLIFYFRFFRKK